jgi:hypothetical protein
MKAKRTNNLEMFNALNKIMESNKKIWMGVKEIEKAYSSFLNSTNKLNFLKEEYDKSLKNLENKKKLNRKDLIGQIIPITKLLTAFAKDFDQKGLIKKCDFTKSKSKKIKDLDLQNYAKQVWKESKKWYDKSIASSDVEKGKDKKKTLNIHDYGLSGQMIDKLEIANIAFIEAHLELNDAISNKEKCSKKIKSGIKANNEILKKLDLLMSIFKLSDNLFYKKYTTSRKIVSTDKPVDVKQKDKTEGTKLSDPVVKKEVEKKSVPVKNTTATASPVKKPVSLPTVAKVVASKPVVKQAVSPKPAVKRPARKRPSPVAKPIELKKESTEPAK